MEIIHHHPAESFSIQITAIGTDLPDHLHAILGTSVRPGWRIQAPSSCSKVSRTGPGPYLHIIDPECQVGFPVFIIARRFRTDLHGYAYFFYRPFPRDTVGKFIFHIAGGSPEDPCLHTFRVIKTILCIFISDITVWPEHAARRCHLTAAECPHRHLYTVDLVNICIFFDQIDRDIVHLPDTELYRSSRSRLFFHTEQPGFFQDLQMKCRT